MIANSDTPRTRASASRSCIAIRETGGTDVPMAMPGFVKGLRMSKRSKIKSQALAHVFLLGLLALTNACSRETKVYPDTVAKADTDSIVTIIDGRGMLPKNFFDLSVNQAKVESALDGADSTSRAVRFVTWPLTNSAGSFNGAGFTGNRALLGLAQYADKKLSALTSISFDSKLVSGSTGLDVLLSVDLDCDGSAPRVLIADQGILGAGTSVANGYSRIEITHADAKWRVYGTAIVDGPSTTVPSTATASYASIDDLLAKHPAACLKNKVVTADEMPKGFLVTGVAFSLGTPNTVSYNGAFISRIAIGSDLYSSADWGSL